MSQHVSTGPEEQIRAFSQLMAESNLALFSGHGASFVASEKAAHSFRTIGLKAFALPFGELFHGDVGALGAGDLLCLVSKSGRLDGIEELLNLSKSRGFSTCLVTEELAGFEGDMSVFRIGQTQEIDPYGLLPTASVLSQISFFDDVLRSLVTRHQDNYVRHFTESHPGGGIGRLLATGIDDLFEDRPAICVTRRTLATLTTREVETLLQESGFGLVVIVDEREKFHQVVTDGDLRRLLDSPRLDMDSVFPTDWLLTKSPPVALADNTMFGDAIKTFSKNPQINALPVITNDRRVVAVIHARHILARIGKSK